jgi:predicted DsbA family dithiol-disulfide isomerase
MDFRVDIISDVVCPWCVLGYHQLAHALEKEGHRGEVFWHPFELNPDMPAEGENLRDHLKQKYGSSDEDSDAARDMLTEVGAEFGFEFNFKKDSRIYNTFKAHQLMHWAGEKGRAQPLKMALFAAYFSDGMDISDPEVLVGVARAAKLDAGEARAVVWENRYASMVREKERFWHARGITGVPSMIFNSKHLVTGAQGIDGYVQVLRAITREMEMDQA